MHDGDGKRFKSVMESDNGYVYDANGNMVSRDINSGELIGDYTLSYDAENRLVGVTKNNASIATFVYDGDGKRVKSVMGSTTTLFIGAHYEAVTVGSTTTYTKYYFAGASRIAMRTSSTLTYLLTDHLNSTSITTNSTGGLVSELRYKPWGETRFTSGTTSTKYQYTGQYSYQSDFGLMFYNARWYDSTTGRFAQADSIIPGAGNSSAWDRYAYTLNNPLRYTDPTGHRNCEEDGYNCPGDEKPKKPIFYSFDGGWNDPKYSTWNLLRQGSACTACHVTHWTGTIPTNDEISLTQVQGWRSFDKYTIPVHLAGLNVISFYVNQAITSADPASYLPSQDQAKVSDAFDDWQVSRTSQPMSGYRYSSPGAEAPSRWLTSNPSLSPTEARSLLALPNNNLATSVTQYVIPEGTTIISGGATAQTLTPGFGAYATGGGFQIYIPNAEVLLGVPLLP